jgi:hypothetical protein
MSLFPSAPTVARAVPLRPLELNYFVHEVPVNETANVRNVKKKLAFPESLSGLSWTRKPLYKEEKR